MTDTILHTYMTLALKQAHKAYDCNETPVGAVLVHANTVVASTHNTTEKQGNALCHAEMMALHMGMQKLGKKRLIDCDLYVTMEPCTMCAGAIAHARIRSLIFGCYDPKGGAIEHGGRVFYHPTIHHKPTIIGGVMEQACGDILRDFFKKKR